MVALHRFLEWRLLNYSPHRNLGGYIYLFLRGIPSESEIKSNSRVIEVPGMIIEQAPIAVIMKLDRVLRGEGF